MVFFLPNFLGHANNYIEANPPWRRLRTAKSRMVFWPFYAILRAFTRFHPASKSYGACLACSQILLWFILPWLDRSTPVRGGHYRPLFRKFSGLA
jgi:ubiquinol-cytochrome c reductase cytochrome b subunit